jgi:hypothetical protein
VVVERVTKRLKRAIVSSVRLDIDGGKPRSTSRAGWRRYGASWMALRGGADRIGKEYPISGVIQKLDGAAGKAGVRN